MKKTVLTRLFAVALILVMLALAAGCGAPATPKPTESPAAEPTPSADAPAPSDPVPSAPLQSDPPEESAPLDEIPPEEELEEEELEETLPEGMDEIQPGSDDGFLWLRVDIGGNADVIDSYEGEDGTRTEVHFYDSAVLISIERLLPAESGEDGVIDSINSLEFIENGKITLTEDDKGTARFSYPTYRATYVTGENEDTQSNSDVYIQTDEWDFRIHIAIPADLAEKYAETAEGWIASAMLSD